MKEEEGEKSHPAPEIDTLILLDRRVDLISPMVTPLTFEALIDETIGIENSKCRLHQRLVACSFAELASVRVMLFCQPAFVSVDSAMIADKDGDESKESATPTPRRGPKVRRSPTAACLLTKQGSSPSCGRLTQCVWCVEQKVALPMNSNDRLFAEIRHMNVTAVGPLLQEKARELQQTYAVSGTRGSAGWCVVARPVRALPRGALPHNRPGLPLPDTDTLWVLDACDHVAGPAQHATNIGDPTVCEEDPGYAGRGQVPAPVHRVCREAGEDD